MDNAMAIEEKPTTSLSKRQQKKLLRKQQWLETKPERRRIEKEKLRQKRLTRQSAGNLDSRMVLTRKCLKESTMIGSECLQRVAIDMSFADYMNERDLAKCVKQIHRSYSANRRSPNPMQLSVTSLSGKCEAAMARNIGYKHWDVHFCSETYLDVFDHNEIVYLTSESENTIEMLDASQVYLIGGLVDHNVHKGLCHRLAQEQGIAHAKLPIENYVDMKTRKVLTVDHVFRILLGVSQGMTWKDAFLTIIPSRKGVTAKELSGDVGVGRKKSPELSDSNQDSGSADSLVCEGTAQKAGMTS